MVTSTEVPPADPKLLIEQYKAYIADLGNVGGRYATANGFYVSVVSALTAVLALAKPASDRDQFALFVRIVIPVVGCIVCWIWQRTIAYYHALFQTKFSVLREIEKAGEGSLFPIYQRDDALLRKNAGFWLTDNEKRVPLFVGIAFALLAIAAIAVYICGLRVT